MSCNSIQNKLREQKGASLAMALFLLIVVTVVATIMINSAYSNAGRVRRNIKAEQNYLAVNSAAELVKSYLSGVTMQCVITETEGSDGTTKWKTYDAGKGDDDNGNKHIWIFQKNGINYYVDLTGNSREQAYVYFRNNGGTRITNDGDIQTAGDFKSATYQYGYFSWQKETYYYYTSYKELISSGSTEPTTTTEITFKDSVSNTEYTGTDYTKSGNPFAVKLMKWFENNRSANSKTENNEYTISVKGSDGNDADITDVKVVLSISGTDFNDASNEGYDKAATYIVASLSLADESSDSSGTGTGSDGTIKKNGNENYYMSITIPFTATKDVQNTGSKSVSDDESGMSLSSLYDEDEDSIDDDSIDLAVNYDDDIEAEDDSATTVTTYTVTTAAASGASNNVDVEKGELSLSSLSKGN